MPRLKKWVQRYWVDSIKLMIKLAIMKSRVPNLFCKGKLYRISWKPPHFEASLNKEVGCFNIGKVKSGSVVLLLEQIEDVGFATGNFLKVIAGALIGWIYLGSDDLIEELDLKS